jgi:hypothetical protein
VARQQVIDPPAWCGAATTALCGGRGDPHPSWRSSLVESGIKVTGNLARALVAKPSWRVKKSSGRDLVIGMQYSSASTIWTRDGFVPTDTTG